jgi:hypothetical protein
MKVDLPVSKSALWPASHNHLSLPPSFSPFLFSFSCGVDLKRLSGDPHEFEDEEFSFLVPSAFVLAPWALSLWPFFSLRSLCPLW